LRFSTSLQCLPPYDVHHLLILSFHDVSD
jgi:hypothetical protein